MSYEDIIKIDPKICFGKPQIKGTRIKVSFILELLASTWTMDEILAEYNHLTEKDIIACLEFSKHYLETSTMPSEIKHEA